MKAELAIRQWSRRTGFNAIVLRFTNVYGSCFDHEARLVPAVISRLLAGKEIIVFGSEDKTISLLHVQDAVQSLLLAIRFASSELDNGAGIYEAFNIGGGPDHDVFNIMEIIEVTGSALNALMSRSTDWRQLISLSRKTTGRAPEPDHFRSDTSKAFRVLGYSHSRSYDENSVTRLMNTCYGVTASSTTVRDIEILMAFPDYAKIVCICFYLLIFPLFFRMRLNSQRSGRRVQQKLHSF
jgi:nucleoside-diphosphate-sugar epimerase